MKNYIYLIVSLVLNSIAVFSQHQEISENPTIWKEKNKEIIDSTSILNAFEKGTFNGHFRYFNMHTINQGDLKDYYANAIGGGVRFETAPFHHFQFGVSGYYVYNIGSSNFLEKDPITNQSNRYEVALFDIQNPAEKTNLSRLEELYLKYNYKKSSIIIGKQLLNNSFLNLQDGRMRPSEVEGVWINFKEIKNTKVDLGYLYAMSPRSTIRYYRVEESIGINPMGVNTDGTKSDYLNNLKSSGIFVFGVENESVKNLKILLWNQFVENIFNTFLTQLDYKLPVSKESNLLFGFQTIYQSPLNNGGNIDPHKTYFDKNATAETFGGKLAWKNKQLEISTNFNRITAKGRYLMPREWGREPFYTFLPRERNEGYGDVTAFMTKFSYNNKKKTFKSYLGAGYYKMPDVKDFRLNKYGMPSYYQTNFDLSYTFSGFLRGFDAHFLYVHKFLDGEVYNNKSYIFNKVNLSNINFIINFNF